ncbi:MAG: 50S ribosomal protein L19e [Candidatus Woesearchaeota archaeon]|nr:MAG: 50S ribosomal protein L19e [Candidatus Woesearchaeota archaeon]
MKLTLQKRLAGQVLKASPKRIKFSQRLLNDIKEAITKRDIKLLIGQDIISVNQKKGVSRARAKKIQIQKTKGLRKGPGSRKGKSTARVKPKEVWMNRIRVQRAFLKVLKEKDYITLATYRNLYRKAKGGYFRNKRHIKLYVEENNLIQTKGDTHGINK